MPVGDLSIYDCFATYNNRPGGLCNGASWRSNLGFLHELNYIKIKVVSAYGQNIYRRCVALRAGRDKCTHLRTAKGDFVTSPRAIYTIQSLACVSLSKFYNVLSRVEPGCSPVHILQCALCGVTVCACDSTHWASVYVVAGHTPATTRKSRDTASQLCSSHHPPLPPFFLCFSSVGEADESTLLPGLFLPTSNLRIDSVCDGLQLLRLVFQHGGRYLYMTVLLLICNCDNW